MPFFITLISFQLEWVKDTSSMLEMNYSGLCHSSRRSRCVLRVIIIIVIGAVPNGTGIRGVMGGFFFRFSHEWRQ